MPFTEMGKVGKIIFGHVKVKISIRHPMEKPMGCWTYRSNRGEVQAAGRKGGRF